MKNILYDTKAAKILRTIYPNISYCGGCGIPWNHCTSKTIMTSKHSGTFATCIDCWNILTLDEIKECYINTYKEQEKQCIMDHTLKELLNCVENEYKLKINNHEKNKPIKAKIT